MRRPRPLVTVLVAAAVAGALLVTAQVAAGHGAGSPVAGPGGAAAGGPSGGPSGWPSGSATPSTTPPASADGSVHSPPLPPVRPFVPVRLGPGERPPQFVVVGFDGSGDVDQLATWAEITQRLETHVTYFLSGVFMLRPGQRDRYRPPRHAPGASDIGFARTPNPITSVTSLLSQAWLDGNDIGTHFNGHFCGPTGVDRWSRADWAGEIRQFDDFVDHWRSYNRLEGDPTAYDHSVVVGGRTPCLEGSKPAYLGAMKDAGFRYDASGTGALQWPRRTQFGLWEFPLQAVRWMGGGNRTQLAMDYNLWYSYNRAQPIRTAAQRAAVSNAVYATYLAAFNATYAGNRAPLFFGNHMNYWGCDPAYKDCLHSGTLQNPTNLQHFGPFVDGLQRAYETMCTKPDVQCVSYKDVADWLDAQDPATVAALQALAPVAG